MYHESVVCTLLSTINTKYFVPVVQIIHVVTYVRTRRVSTNFAAFALFSVCDELLVYRVPCTWCSSSTAALAHRNRYAVYVMMT